MRTFVALALCGCGSEIGAIDAPGAVDALDVDAPASADARQPTCAGATFQTSASIDALNTTERETYVRLAPDELTAYFARGNPESLYVTTRPSTTAPFAMPMALVITGNGVLETTSPSLTADGLNLYFTSDRPGTLGSRDIWRATRAATSTNFGTITALTTLNSALNENDAFVVPDNSAVYFSSSRSGVSRVYRAARQGATFDAPIEVFSDATTVNRVVVSPDELTMLYSNASEMRLSTRASTTVAWLPGVVLTAIDSVASDYPSWISLDLCRLYYGSNRTGEYDLRIAVRAPQ